MSVCSPPGFPSALPAAAEVELSLKAGTRSAPHGDVSGDIAGSPFDLHARRNLRIAAALLLRCFPMLSTAGPAMRRVRGGSLGLNGTRAEFGGYNGS